MTRTLRLTEPAVVAEIGPDKDLRALPLAYAGIDQEVVHSTATEFTLEGRGAGAAALTLVVIPAPLGTSEGPTREEVPSPGLPLGGEILLDASLRMLAFKPVQRAADGAMTLMNQVADSRAEHWETIVAVPHGQGLSFAAATPAGVSHVTPPPRPAAVLGLHPFETSWKGALEMDDVGARPYAITEHRPVPFVAAGEDTCWFDPHFVPAPSGARQSASPGASRHHRQSRRPNMNQQHCERRCPTSHPERKCRSSPHPLRMEEDLHNPVRRRLHTGRSIADGSPTLGEEGKCASHAFCTPV